MKIKGKQKNLNFAAAAAAVWLLDAAAAAEERATLA